MTVFDHCWFCGALIESWSEEWPNLYEGNTIIWNMEIHGTCTNHDCDFGRGSFRLDWGATPVCPGGKSFHRPHLDLRNGHVEHAEGIRAVEPPLMAEPNENRRSISPFFGDDGFLEYWGPTDGQG